MILILLLILFILCVVYKTIYCNVGSKNKIIEQILDVLYDFCDAGYIVIAAFLVIELFLTVGFLFGKSGDYDKCNKLYSEIYHLESYIDDPIMYNTVLEKIDKYNSIKNSYIKLGYLTGLNSSKFKELPELKVNVTNYTIAEDQLMFSEICKILNVYDALKNKKRPTCGACDNIDGMIYTSNPPQVRCNITGEFHYFDDKCNIDY